MMHPSARNEAMRLHVLVSYAYREAGRKVWERVHEEHPEWNLMLDSGAFTQFTKGMAATEVGDYAAFCAEAFPWWWRIINLDRIGDPETSARNLDHLHREGIPALPVFQRGASLRSLDMMAERGDPLCVGGISQNLHAAAEQEYLHRVLRRVVRLGCRVHLLGVGGPTLFRLPAWSGDCSSWNNASRFGSATLWYMGRFHRFRRGRPRPTTENTRVLASYGLNWRMLDDRRNWSKRNVFTAETAPHVHIANVRSWMRVAHQLAAQDKRFVFAGVPTDLPHLAYAWSLERHKWER